MKHGLEAAQKIGFPVMIKASEGGISSIKLSTILLTKISAAEYEVALSYDSVGRLNFLAVIFAATISYVIFIKK